MRRRSSVDVKLPRVKSPSRLAPRGMINSGSSSTRPSGLHPSFKSFPRGAEALLTHGSIVVAHNRVILSIPDKNVGRKIWSQIIILSYIRTLASRHPRSINCAYPSQFILTTTSIYVRRDQINKQYDERRGIPR